MRRPGGAVRKRQIGHATQRYRDLSLQDLSISFVEGESQIWGNRPDNSRRTGMPCNVSVNLDLLQHYRGDFRIPISLLSFEESRGTTAGWYWAAFPFPLLAGATLSLVLKPRFEIHRIGWIEIEIWERRPVNTRYNLPQMAYGDQVW